jgi:type II secretory pathway component PulC
MMKRKTFPSGWDAKRVQKVLAHYEGQSEEEAVAEDEAAYENSTQAMIKVPKALVPAVRELIARHKEPRKI